jgi:signal transduction histidine kinase
VRPVRRLSLSWRILLGILPVLLVALTISVFLQNRFQESEMMDQAQMSAHTYAALIRESLVSMMVNSQEVDTTFLVRVNKIHQFDSLAVFVNELHLREELLSEEQLEHFARKVRPSPLGDSLQVRVLQRGEPAFMRTGEEFRALIPFNATKVCQRCHAVPEKYTLGAADVRFSLERFADAAAGNWRRSIIIFVLFTVITIGISTWVFKRSVARPVDRLVDAAMEIQKGNLHAVVPTGAGGTAAPHDELRFLAERFDDMRESLADKIARLDLANSDLSRRNRELETALAQLHTTQEELMRSERLAVTGKMAAQLSHEINNPIHNTQSLLESSLRRVQDNGQARELIGLALEEVTRMATLTRQLLDVYRGSVTETAMVPVNLGALLQEMAVAHAEAFYKRGITLGANVPDDLPPVFGSRDKLKQVLLNLMLNARDAMPQGGSLTLSASASDAGVEICVADTGAGIPPEHRDRIFDAFFTTKREVSGVGLGLSVTYGIITQHKGTIEVDSEPGKGTSFTIRLPRAHDQAGHESHSRT